MKVRDAAGGEIEMTEEGTIVAFNGAARLKHLSVHFYYKEKQYV